MKIKKIHTKINYSRGNDGRHGIVIHYTGNSTDTARANANYFRTDYRGASAHYFVDTREIVEVVAPKNTSWAVGVNYGGKLFGTYNNRNTISIEMCSNNRKIADETFDSTVELTKCLMKKYNIPASRVVRHYDVCGKQCPGWRGWIGDDHSLWTKFKKAIGGSTSTTATTKEKLAPLTIDGRFGAKSCTMMQRWLGTPEDGVLSGQYEGNKRFISQMDYCCEYGYGGSTAIRVLQTKVGEEADGYLGKGTITALQKMLIKRGFDIKANGVADVSTVKAFQRFLNATNN